MTKRPAWLSIVVCLVVAVAILAYPGSRWLNYRQAKLTQQQAREIVDRELPTGTDKSVVKQFLDAKHWVYSDGGSTFQAIVRDGSRNNLIGTNIRIQFFFDANNKLVSYELQDLYTGP
jgi:hypothetical protein